MGERENFEKLYAQVCDEQKWEAGSGEVVIALESGRRQVVHHEFFEFEDQALVRFYSSIGNAERVDPLRLIHALRMSFGFPHGAMALKGDDLVMVETAMLRDIDAGRILARVRYLAETADHLEKTIFGPDAA